MLRAYSYIILGLALAGWVIYQMAIRKKKFSQLKNEIFFILFFIGTWIAIYYRAMR